jgi:hypothetical protein
VRAFVVVLLVLALAPASAIAAPTWRDAGAEVPSTVDLLAVAAEGQRAIAVGTDRETHEAAAYRLVGGVWQRDLPAPSPDEEEAGETAPPPILGRLVDVALSGPNAWAVGAKPDGTPLLLRLDDAVPADPAAVAQAAAEGRGDEKVWTAVEAPAAMAAATTIALSGDDGVVGDASGHLFAISGGAVADEPLARGGVAPPPATPVNGVTLTASDSAYAIARPQDGWSGFLGIGGGEVRREVAESIPAGLEPVALAASATEAVAVDGPGPCRDAQPGAAPGLWSRDGSLSLWRRTTPAASATGTRWCDLALTDGALLVGGDRATATGRVGAIWRRTPAGTLRLERDLDARAIHGVAAGEDQSFAVGAAGALWRYAQWPAPEDTGATGETGGGGTQAETHTDTVAADARAEDPRSEDRPEEPTTPAPETIVASLPPAPDGATVKPATRRTTKTKRARRLLVGLEATRTGRRLVLRFRLRARARVLVTALRGRRVLGRSASRALEPGAQRIVVRFKGRKPPTRLKIVVRPAAKPGANKEGKGS